MHFCFHSHSNQVMVDVVMWLVLAIILRKVLTIVRVHAEIHHRHVIGPISTNPGPILKFYMARWLVVLTRTIITKTIVLIL